MPKLKVSPNDRYRVLEAICTFETSEVQVADVLSETGVSIEILESVVSEFDGGRYINEGTISRTPDLYDAYVQSRTERIEAEQQFNTDMLNAEYDYFHREHPKPVVEPISENQPPLVINLFAGPGAGKTTAAYEISAALKKAGYNVEYVSEYAKELVLEKKLDLLNDQKHVTDEQYRRLDRLRNSGVEIIVTDSPVLLGQIYGEGKIDKEYQDKILSYHNSFQNFNLVVKRGETYQTEGRLETFDEAKAIDGKITGLLRDNGIFYGNYHHDEIEKTVERVNATYSRLFGEKSAAVEPAPQVSQPIIQSSRWQQLQLDNDCLVQRYDNGTMFRIPPGCQYSGYVFFHPNSLVKDGVKMIDLQSDTRERCKNLLYTEGYTFTLKNKGEEVKLTGEQLKTELQRASAVPQYENGKEYLQNCPSALRDARKFVCLRLTWDGTKGKFAKMPINPHTGKAAQVNNPETWGSFEEATAAIDKYGIKGGIGYILTGDDNIVGIDLDLDKTTHELTENGKKILDQMKGKTYIEYSASGALHVFGFGEKPGTFTRGMGDSSLELYGSSKEGNRSLMITGKVFEGKAVPLANIQADVDKIYKQYFERPEPARAAESVPHRESTLEERQVIEKLKSAANAPKFERLMAGNTSDYSGDYSLADLGLCSLIAFYTRDERVIDSIYRRSGLYSAEKINTETGRLESRAKKWDSARPNGTYGQETIARAIAGLTKTYTSDSNEFEQTSHLLIYKKTDKAVLVKVPEKDGVTRKATWLPKSRVLLDKDGRYVTAADKKLIEDNHLPRFVPKLAAARRPQ